VETVADVAAVTEVIVRRIVDLSVARLPIATEIVTTIAATSAVVSTGIATEIGIVVPLTIVETIGAVTAVTIVETIADLIVAPTGVAIVTVADAAQEGIVTVAASVGSTEIEPRDVTARRRRAVKSRRVVLGPNGPGKERRNVRQMIVVTVGTISSAKRRVTSLATIVRNRSSNGRSTASTTTIIEAHAR
jgi:hypothetical protein